MIITGDQLKEFYGESSGTEEPTPSSVPSTARPRESGFNQFAMGLGKGVLQTTQGLGQLGLKGVKAVTGKDFGTEATFFKDPNALKANTPLEKVGKFTEQVAEFAVPGSKVSKLTQGMKFLPKIGARAGTSGLVATGQSGDVGKEAAIAAGVEMALPVAGKFIVKPATRIVGNLLKGTGSGLSGAPASKLEEIFGNPKAALETAKEIRKTGGSKNLETRARKIIEGISNIKKEARKAYGEGLEKLSEIDINPSSFKSTIGETLDEFGSLIEGGRRKLSNIEFDDPKNVKKANELIDKLQKVELNGTSLRKLSDDIENARYNIATSDERLSFNAFTKELSESLKRAISSSTNKLDDINQVFSQDMQLAEVTEQIFGKSKFKNLREILNTSKKLEQEYSNLGLSEKYVDDFLTRIGVDPGDFKGSEAMRQVFQKDFGANQIGANKPEMIRTFTSAVVTPQMVGQIAARLGVASSVVKEMSEKLSLTSRAAIIKLLLGEPTEKPNSQ